MASSSEVQVFIDKHHQTCVAALKRIAALCDTGTPEHKNAFADYYDNFFGRVPGWRVAEAARQVAVTAIGDMPKTDAHESQDELLIYKRAMESMAAQLIHPKMTALELAREQLK
jgi:hypothetical protein